MLAFNVSPNAGAGSGDDNSQSPNGSEPIGAGYNMNPLQWSFLNEPAWKWAVFFMACSLFAVAWSGALRYMK